jgi:hypothetical protein
VLDQLGGGSSVSSRNEIMEVGGGGDNNGKTNDCGELPGQNNKFCAYGRSISIV